VTTMIVVNQTVNAVQTKMVGARTVMVATMIVVNQTVNAVQTKMVGARTVMVATMIVVNQTVNAVQTKMVATATTVGVRTSRTTTKTTINHTPVRKVKVTIYEVGAIHLKQSVVTAKALVKAAISFTKGTNTTTNHRHLRSMGVETLFGFKHSQWSRRCHRGNTAVLRSACSSVGFTKMPKGAPTLILRQNRGASHRQSRCCHRENTVGLRSTCSKVCAAIVRNGSGGGCWGRGKLGGYEGDQCGRGRHRSGQGRGLFLLEEIMLSV